MNGQGGDRPGGKPAPGQGPGSAMGPVGALRELMKSTLGFSWAMSLFGVKSLSNALAPDKAVASLDAVAQATGEQLGDGLRPLFQAGDRMQRGLVDMMFGAAPGMGAAGGGAAGPPGMGATGTPQSAAPGSTVSMSSSAALAAPLAPRTPVDAGRLDRGVFVVLGEGLAAGAGDFALWDDFQRWSFPAQMACQMQTDLVQPLLQQPGIGNLPGFPPLPVVIPGLMQTTVLEPWPPPAAVGNLSVPGFRIADALKLRPQPPLVHRDDARQTAANLILGMPEMLEGAAGELPTQLQRALQRRPTLALVALGYTEAIEAVVTGDTRRLPDAARCRADYLRLLKPLREAGAAVLVMNVPDPLDTACVSSIAAAAQVVKLEPAILLKVYGLHEDDLITVRGLVEIGYQFLSQGLGPLPQGSVLSGETAGRISARIREINAELANLAREQGAFVCDLHALFRRVRAEGVGTGTGSRRLTAGFLGGLYTLNGYYPGRTGQALIANEALQLLNQVYGASFPLIDLGPVAASDPVVLYQPAEGPELTAGQLPPPPPAQPAQPAQVGTSATGGAAASPVAPKSAAVRRPVDQCPQPPLAKPLELPPGLEQILPLNKERSYFGDALRAVDCQDPRYAAMGGCGGVLFGGLALMDSHLSGQVRIRFSPPVNNVTQFELSVLDGLQGDDGILAAPQFFKLPGKQQQVTDFPGMVSTGLLDLTTGQLVEPPAATPNLNFAFANTAIFALALVNPNFPRVPISFPGQYGTAVAQFTQRADGKLDFELFGTTFLPLQQVFGAQPVRFPLPFASLAGQMPQFASIPTRGLALHPHIFLSTREGPIETPEGVPEIPTNTVREFTYIARNTSFGDDFTLTGEFLGGTGTGRSQLMGRLHVQFGEREGNTVPFYVSGMPPGGFLAPAPEPPGPISQGLSAGGFPGQLATGQLGFNEFLRFPRRSFYLDDVFLVSDPFDLAVGAVDVRTGEVLGGQLHRGFIGQNVFFALLRVEPRTPSSSFLFRGPASFQKTPRGETVYRFCGEVHIPYPEGFLFPQPNLAVGFPAGPGSSLDPFFWIQAVDGDPAPPQFAKKGSATKVLASSGDSFSYSYDIPADPGSLPASFEYENHSQNGKFRLRSLSWVHFANPLTSRAGAGDYDVVAFAGYGIWSKNGKDFPLPVTVQISTARNASFVGIQIDGGATSNVNTKPPIQKDVLP